MSGRAAGGRRVVGTTYGMTLTPPARLLFKRCREL
jgi:hypothetical protein